MAHQYIFTMQNLRRVHPPNKEVLKGIYLSFFPGAKIGVIGSNGSGKSTLLRIMAGVDKDFFGEAKPADGITIGYLSQEPQLDPKKNVLGNVEEAVAHIKKLLTRFDEVNMRLGEDLTPDEMEKLLEEQGKLQDAIEAGKGWELDRTLEIAMDALRLPPADAGWPGARCRCSTRTCSSSTSPPTTWTPRAWPGWSTSSRSTPARWWR
jgi:energy-dependent translational throttle protein EttA